MLDESPLALIGLEPFVDIEKDLGFYSFGSSITDGVYSSVSNVFFFVFSSLWN